MSEWKANTAALKAAIAELAAAKETRGIKQKGGKKYTVVADRVEALRNHLGDVVSIQTEIIHYSPKDKSHPIVVQACIYMYDAASPRLVATGFAEEWRDEGYVNATSALENCETSAIGRALANLGLHGGEYASANEIEIAETKREHLSKATPKVTVAGQEGVKVEVAAAPKVEVKATPAPQEAPQAASGWDTLVAAAEVFLPSCATLEDLTGFWTKNAALIEDLKQSDPKKFQTLRAMFTARRAFIEKEANNG
jgi:hypothetical protein